MVVVAEGEDLGTGLMAGPAGAGFDVDVVDVRKNTRSPLGGRPVDIAFPTLPWQQIDDVADALRDEVRGHVLVFCVGALTQDSGGYYIESGHLELATVGAVEVTSRGAVYASNVFQSGTTRRKDTTT